MQREPLPSPLTNQTLVASSGVIVLVAFLAGCDLPPRTSPVGVAAPPEPRQPLENAERKHIVLFVGDGMQLEHEIAASRYLTGADSDLVFHSFEYRGFATTWDVTTYNSIAWDAGEDSYDPESFSPDIGYDIEQGGAKPYPLDKTPTRDGYFIGHPATDSAASITAMMTGRKTDSGNVCWLPGDPQDGALVTIAEKLRNRLGYAVGVVSTVPFNHATPAGVVAHNSSRYNYSGERKNERFDGLPIAEEMVRIAKPEVVIGGGHPQWISGYLTDELYRELKTSDEYVIVERVEGADGGDAVLQGARRAVTEHRKLWGLFGGSNGSFDAPIPTDTPGAPSFLIGEENPTLAEAVEATLETLAADPDGFFVVFEQGNIDWASHNNNFALVIGNVVDLNSGVTAAVDFVERPGDDIDWTNTLIIVTADHACGYLRMSEDKAIEKGDLPRQILNQTTVKYEYPNGEISFGSDGHTNELVMVYARGDGVDLLADHEGEWYPGTRIIDNTHVYKAIREMTQLE